MVNYWVSNVAEWMDVSMDGFSVVEMDVLLVAWMAC